MKFLIKHWLISIKIMALIVSVIMIIVGALWFWVETDRHPGCEPDPILIEQRNEAGERYYRIPNDGAWYVIYRTHPLGFDRERLIFKGEGQILGAGDKFYFGGLKCQSYLFAWIQLFVKANTEPPDIGWASLFSLQS